ncbi:GAF domain-containing protein, partial [Phaeovulum sp.]|uniref:GAF domain-containing protein n=1 Tax=Phaeovulum sp. TaxID=2934796 RepID=UPI003563B78F
AVARSGKPMNVPDVAAFADHIACSSTTRSELVLPVHGLGGRLIGVLDIDSNTPAAFDDADTAALQAILTEVFGAI